jgi:cell wall-associated NlpC family hydrolase
MCSTFQVPGSRFVVTVLGSFVVLGSMVLGSACASHGTAGVSRPRPFPGSTRPPVEGSAPAPAGTAAAPGPADAATGAAAAVPLLSTALALRGIAYRNGGSDMSGFDCSGFVQYVFAQHGLVLPREVRDQYRIGEAIDRDDVRPGDLVFFETVSRGASHVGIALGDNAFVHAPSSRGVVRVERYTSAYWNRRWIGARRLQED